MKLNEDNPSIKIATQSREIEKGPLNLQNRRILKRDGRG